MKKSPILFTLFLALLFSACRNDNNAATDDFYINFDFDGTPVAYSTIATQTGGGYNGHNIISSTIAPNGSDGATVVISMDRASITYDDLKSLEGSKLGVCTSTPCQDFIYINVEYSDGNTNWEGEPSNNALPNQYLSIDQVELSSTDNPFGGDRFMIITGKFNLVLSDKSNPANSKTASNGQFRLQFAERL